MNSIVRKVIDPSNYDHLHTGGLEYYTQSQIATQIGKNILTKEDFDNFLRLRVPIQLKKITRHNSNHYVEGNTNRETDRKETTAEHVSTGPKLIDFFIFTEPEFANLDRLKCLDLWNYHDDCEIKAGDTNLFNKNKRKNKEQKELAAVLGLSREYPKVLGNRLEVLDKELREGKTQEAKFIKHGIDRFEALIHELDYPSDWGPKGWTEEVVRDRYSAIKYSPTFTKYFETMILYMREHGYFKTDSST